MCRWLSCLNWFHLFYYLPVSIVRGNAFTVTNLRCLRLETQKAAPQVLQISISEDHHLSSGSSGPFPHSFHLKKADYVTLKVHCIALPRNGPLDGRLHNLRNLCMTIPETFDLEFHVPVRPLAVPSFRIGRQQELLCGRNR